MQYYKANSYPTKYHGSLIKPEIFVWHSTAGGDPKWLDQLFSGLITNGGSKITVHFAIYKNGDLVEYAPWKNGEAVACWHAGTSVWEGRTSCNMFSIGCEIQHARGEDFTPEQIEAIEFLAAMVQKEYPQLQHTTHKFISGEGIQGKTDPYSPHWESQGWPAVQKGLNQKEEDDMTSEQATWLEDLRFKSAPKQSIINAITNAVLVKNYNEAKRLNDLFYKEWPYPASTTGLPVGWTPPSE